MTVQSTPCTCPSGDGSLRWPCPTHPPIVTEQSTPTATDEVDLGALLDALFYDRGNVVTNWPEDEAEAYREFRWAEGDAAARKLVVSKAAAAVIAAGWKSPAEVAELVRAGAEEAWDDCAIAITYDPNDPITNPHRKSISDRVNSTADNERNT